jgi:signal peptidase II
VVFAVVAVLVFAIDRITKAIVASSIPLGDEIPALDHFLWITHVQNSGAAFGFAPFGSIFFLAISVIVAVALVVYVAREGGSLVTDVLLGLVLGGTVGNAYDRVLHGSVTDFFTVHWWPVFNVADSAISTGVVLLVLSQLFRRTPEPD